MNEQFQHKVLHIESEQMLDEVKEILVESGQAKYLNEEWLYFCPGMTNNYLFYDKFFKSWSLYFKIPHKIEISLLEFKELLKNPK